MEEDLAQYAADRVWKRGASLITGTRVQKIEPGKVVLPAGTQVRGARAEGDEQSVIEAEKILLAAGIVANPLLESFSLEKGRNGRIAVERTMRCKARPEIW